MVGVSQSHHVDSLSQLLTQEEDAVQRIDILLGLARQNMLGAGSIEVGLTNAQDALMIARSISSKKYEAMSMTFVGMLHYNLSTPYREILESAKNIAVESRDPNAIAFCTYPWVEVALLDYNQGIVAVSYTHLTLPTIYSV